MAKKLSTRKRTRFTVVTGALLGLPLLASLSFCEDGAAEQRPVGKAPPIPQAGLLAEPRSLKQVGLPLVLTRSVMPADNLQTPEKIALGKRLFFDGRLSADGTVACATCHDPAHAFTDGRPVSIGIRGQRNAPTVLNALYNKTQFCATRSER
jgi:cytochrome c peroxidase